MFDDNFAPFNTNHLDDFTAQNGFGDSFEQLDFDNEENAYDICGSFNSADEMSELYRSRVLKASGAQFSKASSTGAATNEYSNPTAPATGERVLTPVDTTRSHPVLFSQSSSTSLNSACDSPVHQPSAKSSHLAQQFSLPHQAANRSTGATGFSSSMSSQPKYSTLQNTLSSVQQQPKQYDDVSYHQLQQYQQKLHESFSLLHSTHTDQLQLANAQNQLFQSFLASGQFDLKASNAHSHAIQTSSQDSPQQQTPQQQKPAETPDSPPEPNMESSPSPKSRKRRKQSNSQKSTKICTDPHGKKPQMPCSISNCARMGSRLIESLKGALNQELKEDHSGRVCEAHYRQDLRAFKKGSSAKQSHEPPSRKRKASSPPATRSKRARRS